jgi:hypothetical protein
MNILYLFIIRPVLNEFQVVEAVIQSFLEQPDVTVLHIMNDASPPTATTTWIRW